MAIENVVYLVTEVSGYGRSKILDSHGSKEAGHIPPRQKRLSETDQRLLSRVLHSLPLFFCIIL